MNGIDYRQEIDGLRAVAVLAVVFFHAGCGVSGGFVGVDVFFVISGFLITSLILKRTDTQSFSLQDFWLRRIRRIVPALVVVVGFVVIASTCFMLPQDLEKVGKSAVAQAIASANIYFWRDAGYFSEAADIKPLLHTWSLAVEEQFYLLLPLLLIATQRRNRRTQIVVLGTIAAASFTACLWMTSVRPATAFFLLPFRAWELLAGSLLACLPAPGSLPRPVRETLSWTGVMGILIPCFAYSEETLFPGWAAVPPVAGTVLFLFANTGQLTSLGRLLSRKPLVGIGLISYSLYLWHWPLLALLRYWVPDLAAGTVVGLLAVSFVLAYLSWRYVETPFRRQLAPVHQFSRVRLLVSMQVALILLGASLDVTEGFPSRLSDEFVQLNAKNTWASLSNQQVAAGQLKPLGVADNDEPISFLLWGDSHARAIALCMSDLAAECGLRGGVAALSNPEARFVPRPDEEVIRTRNARIEALVYKHQIKHIFFVQRWEETFEYHSPDSDQFTQYTEQQKQQMDRILPDLVGRLGDHGCTVHLLCQVPKQRGGRMFRQVLFRQTVFPHSRIVTPVSIDEYDREAFWMRQLEPLARLPHVHLLDIRPYCFDEQGQSIVFVDGTSCYRDDDHLSDFGSRLLLGPIFSPILQSLRDQSRYETEPSRMEPLAERPDAPVVR